MNLLNFIDILDLNQIENKNEMPISFQMINLHTRDLNKAIKQCDNFFVIKREQKEKIYYYTQSSSFQWFGGWEYRLNKSKDNIYWLILNNDNVKIEI